MVLRNESGTQMYASYVILGLARALRSDRATGLHCVLGLAEGVRRGSSCLAMRWAYWLDRWRGWSTPTRLVDLGAAIRRCGRRTDARGPLAWTLRIAAVRGRHSLPAYRKVLATVGEHAGEVTWIRNCRH